MHIAYVPRRSRGHSQFTFTRWGFTIPNVNEMLTEGAVDSYNINVDIKFQLLRNE